MNNVILTGNLTKDIEIKQTSTTVGKFGLAVKGYKQDEVNFINCVCFGKTADIMSQYLTKGSKVLVEGSIKTGSYDNEQGQKVYTTDVIVNRFEFIGAKQDNNSNKTGNSFDRFNNSKVDDMMPVDNGDIPF